MPEDSSDDTPDPDSPYIGPATDDIVEIDQLQLTPEQHEKLKNKLHDSDQLTEIRRSDRRYLVIGQGGDDPPGERRREVCRQLDARHSATAFRLEDFGFTPDEIDLWAPAFEQLAALASHIVGVLEDFDGGHVWELGLLYHQQRQFRDILWLLKRVYETEDKMREHYDNGMAASHLAAIERATADRVITWEGPDALSDAVAQLP